MRTLVVGMLLVALPIYGSSGVLLQLLGAPHRHRAVETAQTSASVFDALLKRVFGESTMELISEFRMKTAFTEQKAPAMPKVHHHAAGIPGHSHGLFERHHHDADDETVVTLGAATPGGDLAGDAASAAVGSATLALGLAGAFVFPVQERMTGPWPVAVGASWRSLQQAPLERPPRLASIPAFDGRVMDQG